MDKKIKNLMNSNSEVQRSRRYKQMAMEQNASNRLKSQGWEIFSPTVVCDRIGVKNGKVYLIEFKKPGQKLTEHQAKIKSLTDDYLVENY